MIYIKCKIGGFVYAYFIFLTKKFRFLCVTPLPDFEFFALLLLALFIPSFWRWFYYAVAIITTCTWLGSGIYFCP